MVMSMDLPVLSGAEIDSMLDTILTSDQQARFTEHLEIDFAYAIPEVSRFRINIFKQNHGTAAAIRLIPHEIPNFESLGLPEIFKEFTTLTKGLVLVTGPTGSGKSSTLAAVINHINAQRHKHIITIEDPIEFIYQSNKALINQREVGSSTININNALKSALREDPDIILVGEMRDLETIKLALTASETGHLVFGTLHTTSALQTVNRIIDVFPGNEQKLVRSMLSECLSSVISQRLIKRKASGRVAALEIMRNTHAISNMIREDKILQIYSSIQSGANSGMQTLDQHLHKLINEDIITLEEAKIIAYNPDEFMN